MDEMENQDLPLVSEDMEDTIIKELLTLTEDTPAAEEASAEEPVPEPVVQELPTVQQPVHTSRRRSPYENSPYMMAHQQNRPAAEPAAMEQPVPGKQKKQKKQKKGHPVLMTVLIILLLAVSVSVTASLVSGYMEDQTAVKLQVLEERIEVLQAQLDAWPNADSGNSVSGTPNAGVDSGMTPAQVFARNQQSVVLIETDVATGSGFILTEDGYVVTNYHVVEDGKAISVVLYDNSYLDAELVGFDANNDVALLKMEGQGFRAVTLGSSDALIVGDQVAAIGNPLGELTSTLTVGYVSAKERDVSTDDSVINMIQTDCAINSGNSGGPLFNMKGEVVGITTAKYSGLSSSGASIEGIGFAIPMDDVVGILDDLKEFGYVKSGYLGVTVYTLTPADSKQSGDPLGCLVNEVTMGSCAQAAGVLPGDIITGLGGHKIDGYTDLARALREFDGGETTTITVYRSGEELILTITLDERPRETTVQPSQPSMPEDGSYEEWYNYFFGE